MRRLVMTMQAYREFHKNHELVEEFYNRILEDVSNRSGCVMCDPGPNVLKDTIDIECGSLPCHMCAYDRDNYRDDEYSVKKHGLDFAYWYIDHEDKFYDQQFIDWLVKHPTWEDE